MRTELEQEWKHYFTDFSGGSIEFDRYWQHIHVPVTALTFLLVQGKSIPYFLQYKSWQPFARSSAVKSTEFEHYTIDLELAIDPPPPRGSFVHYNFLKLHYMRNKMTHVSPLHIGALTCNVNVNNITQNHIFRLR